MAESAKSETVTEAGAVSSGKVARWAKGLMMGVISRREAEQLVAKGEYYWIHSGAIDWKGCRHENFTTEALLQGRRAGFAVMATYCDDCGIWLTGPQKGEKRVEE